MSVIHPRQLFAILFSCGLLLSNSSLAQKVNEDEEPEKNAEAAVVLPATPQTENLVTFYQSETQSFAIDLNSLSIPGDGSVRYSLIATSQAGAKNISYEAIRCNSYDKKILALGRSDKSWVTPKKSEWLRISSRSYNKQHSILASEYFCAGLTITGKVSQIAGKLKLAKP